MDILLFPISLLSYFLSVMIVDSTLGILYCLFFSDVRLFDDDIIFGGFVDVLEDIFDFNKNFLKI